MIGPPFCTDSGIEPAPPVVCAESGANSAFTYASTMRTLANINTSTVATTQRPIPNRDRPGGAVTPGPGRAGRAR
ncbi:hypothetical protein GCM10009558_056500 [Virgisporangium aurantiacum]